MFFPWIIKITRNAELHQRADRVHHPSSIRTVQQKNNKFIREETLQKTSNDSNNMSFKLLGNQPDHLETQVAT